MALCPLGFNKVLYHVEYILPLVKAYTELFEWPHLPHLKMIDIGTGPGHVLMKVENLIPKNYAEVLAVDKDENMINYFNSIPKNSKISCRFLDIESEKLPDDLKGRFDFAFSSYCLTYVKNFRQTFQNTSKLLRPNGEMFFLWCKKCYIYDIYEILSRTTKWASYTSDFKGWKTFSDNDDPIGTFKPECDRANLKILKADVVENIQFKEIDIQAFLDVFRFLDIVSERIPKSDLPKYEEDFFKLARSYIIIDESAEDPFKVKLPFPTIVVAAKKM